MGDFEVESSISSAVSEGDFAKTCQLLTGKGYFSVLAVGGSLLLSACRIGQCEIVELILHMSHLNVNEHYDSTTALAEACKYGHHECAKLLLRHHADPDIGSGYYREPPLYSASDSGHFLCVKALLEGGANPDLPDKEGSNSAFIAAHQNHPDILELLCEYGGDMNLGTREFNVTPLYIAAQNGFTEAVNLLLTKGNANPNIARTRDNATPLFTATLVGHITTAERLVDAHADVNFPSKNGTTPFHIACLRGIETLVEKMIVYASADVNYPRIGDGATPLHIATRAGRVNIVKLLLKYHADVNKKSASFVTPLQVAQAEKSSTCSKGHQLMQIADLTHWRQFLPGTAGFICYLCGIIGKGDAFPAMFCSECVFSLCMKCMVKWSNRNEDDEKIIEILKEHSSEENSQPPQ